MAFNRSLAPAAVPDSDALTSAMVAIGMRFAAHANDQQPNIEDTLLFAAIEAMERGDLRVLAVLVTWFGIHHPWVNVDRLTRLVADQPSRRVRALFAALARWQLQDRRYRRMSKIYRGPRIDVLAAGAPFQIRRHGEDPRFAGGPLRVPGNLLRDRASDVLAPPEVAKRHRAYHYRVLIGPSYRADAWAALEREPSLTPTELARLTYTSFATAWHVKRDFAIVAVQSRSLRGGGTEAKRPSP
jgi:hypothetical protein